MLSEDLAGRVLPFDGAAAHAHAVIAAARREAGRLITHADGQIAAIVRCRGASVATPNADDVAWGGGDVSNPWVAG